MMKTEKKKEYEAPQLTGVSFNAENGFAQSGGLLGFFGLGGAWSNSGGDAWDGSSSGDNGSSFGGGWTDNGGSAWD